MNSKTDSSVSYCPPALIKTNGYTLYRLVLPLLVAVACIYYYYIVVEPAFWPINYHSAMAESFLAGHTYLLHYYPTRELLSLPDPYDSNVSKDYALWDASLYKNRYYLYFGPVPALLIAPVLYFTGHIASDPIITWLFCCVGTACLGLLLTSVASRQRMASPVGIAFGIIAIALGTWIPFMLRRASFYEVAVAGAYCFGALGALLLWRAVHSSRIHLWMALASLSLGLAVGCRHLHVFNVFLLCAAWLLTRRSQAFTKLLCLFLPWGLCLLGLMAYNYARFDSVFESGLHYQITVFNTHSPDFAPLQSKRFIQNLYYYFFRPLDWQPELVFPYVKVTYYNNHTLFGSIFVETLEPLYGLFSNSPFSLLLFTIIYTSWQRPRRYSAQALTLLGGIVLYMTCIIGYLMFFLFSTTRYAVDFAPWLMLIAALQYLQLLASAKTRTGRIALYTIGCLAVFYGAFTGVMSGYCGQLLCDGM